MTERQREQTKFVGWLIGSLVAVGIAIGTTRSDVSTNGKAIAAINECDQKQGEQITELRIQTAKLEDIHLDVKQMQDTLNGMAQPK